MALMQEFEHTRIKQEEEVKQILDEERKKMGEEISIRVCEEKEKIQKEMNDHLKVGWTHVKLKGLQFKIKVKYKFMF